MSHNSSAPLTLTLLVTNAVNMGLKPSKSHYPDTDNSLNPESRIRTPDLTQPKLALYHGDMGSIWLYLECANLSEVQVNVRVNEFYIICNKIIVWLSHLLRVYTVIRGYTILLILMDV